MTDFFRTIIYLFLFLCAFYFFCILDSPLVYSGDGFCSLQEAQDAANLQCLSAPSSNSNCNTVTSCMLSGSPNLIFQSDDGCEKIYRFVFSQWKESYSCNTIYSVDMTVRDCTNPACQPCSPSTFNLSVSGSGSVSGTACGHAVTGPGSWQAILPECGCAVSLIASPNLWDVVEWDCNEYCTVSGNSVTCMIGSENGSSVAGHCTASFKPAAFSCNDENPCTDDVLVGDECKHYPIKNCNVCTKNDDCDDSDPCTDQTCVSGKCQYKEILGCRENCGNDSSLCDDKDPCTDDICLNSMCYHFDLGEDCNPGRCNGSADCNDDDICTDDVCNISTGECSNPITSGALFLGCKENCVDDSECISPDVSVTGKCIDTSEGRRCSFHHNPKSGLCPNGSSDCQDGDPCTDNICVNGFCVSYPVPNCNKDEDGDGNEDAPKDPTDPDFECTLDGQCNDKNKCTKDWCKNGKCQFDPIPGCVPDTPVDPNNPDGTLAGNWSKEDDQGKQISLASDTAVASKSIDGKMTDVIKGLVGDKGSVKAAVTEVENKLVTTNEKINATNAKLDTLNNTFESEKQSASSAKSSAESALNGINTSFEAIDKTVDYDTDLTGNKSAFAQFFTAHFTTLQNSFSGLLQGIGVDVSDSQCNFSASFNLIKKTVRVEFDMCKYEGTLRIVGNVFLATVYLWGMLLLLKS